MKKQDIRTGDYYHAKVSGKRTVVKVLSIDRREANRYSKATTRYRVLNTATGRETVFRSAMKFERLVDQNEVPSSDKPPRRPRTVADVDRDQGREMESALGPVPDSNNGGVAGYLKKRETVWSRSVDAARSSKYPPTPEQQSILDLASSGEPVIMIEAGAGTGKTTTDRMLVDVLPGVGQYTAFNSLLVADSATKFRGTRCSCNTTHSLAFRAEGKRFEHRLNGPRVRSDKIATILGIEDLKLPTGTKSEDGRPEYKRLPAGFLASKVLGAVRKFCQSADDEPGEDHFRYIDGIDFPDSDGNRTYTNNRRVREYLVPFARKAWADLSDPKGTLPFSHDHYVKVWQLNNPVISADYILLDEAQDTAPVMLDILRQQVDRPRPEGERGPMVIVVGDSAQQIYEWRGAVNALAAFPDAPRRYLSQSFRFGPAIAAVANRVLESLSEGTELRLTGFDKINSRVEPTDNPNCVLTRTNAVALATLLGAISEGKRVFLVGGGSDVQAFIEAARDLQAGKSTSHPDLACFDSWDEVERYSQQEDGEDLRLMVKLIKEFTTATLLDALKATVNEQDADLVICTAHKSKGREWDRVKLARDFPTNSKSSDSDRKLLYVAVTRAKEILDVSECPFFTGDDSLDISAVMESMPRPEPGSIVPAAPSTPPEGPQGFTWSRWRKTDEWAVRGPSGSSGRVEVFRKDGSSSFVELGEVLMELEQNWTVYRVRK